MHPFLKTITSLPKFHQDYVAVHVTIADIQYFNTKLEIKKALSEFGHKVILKKETAKAFLKALAFYNHLLGME